MKMVVVEGTLEEVLQIFSTLFPEKGKVDADRGPPQGGSFPEPKRAVVREGTPSGAPFSLVSEPSTLSEETSLGGQQKTQTETVPPEPSWSIPAESVAGISPLPEQQETGVVNGTHNLLYQEGLNAWYGLLHTWAQNFGVEGTPQPDRANALTSMFNEGGRAPWIYLDSFGGLTQALRPLAPQWSNGKIRRIAENICQVASALDYVEVSDKLEYKAPWISWAKED